MTLTWTAVYDGNEVREWTADYTKGEFKEVFDEQQRADIILGKIVMLTSTHVKYFVKS
jgi:hypothetical protein